MSENAKKGLLIGVIAVALIIVGTMFVKTTSDDRPTVVKTIGGPVVSEKAAAIKAAAEGKTSAGVPSDEAGGG